MAGIHTTAGEPRKRRRNNHSRLRRNARRLQYFLDRKSSSGNKPLADLPNSSVAPGTANIHQIEHAEADYLKDFIEKDVFCVDFAIKEGQPALDLEVTNGNHMWTSVQAMKPNVLLDELVEPHGAVDIPVSELSKLYSIEYCGRDSDNGPCVILRKGCLEVWTCTDCLLVRP